MKALSSNTVILVPSYNEERTIGGLVKDINRMGMTALVIDDGSLDDTGNIALDNGAVVIRNKKNRGKGFCVRAGIEHVVEKTNFEWIIIMDADGQHHTEDIPVLMEATARGYTDMVNGNRMFNTETMPVLRYLTNRITSWVISRICRQYIPDTQCGYRIVRTDALKKMNLMSDRYDIESEMLIEAAEQDMIIRSVPIRTIYGEEGSQINKIRDTLRFFSLIIKYKIRQYELRRKKKKMVDEQLIPRGISRPDVLDAFSKVPRHFFVPDSARHASYEDHPLQIGEGQTISQPYIVALMTQLLPQGISRVLEVGTGSGYQAAILSEIYPEVHTVERKASLQEKAREILGNAGYGNIEFHTGDGTMGVNEAAPFGGIIVTAAAPSVPEPLIEQLKDGGSIVIPIGSLYSQVLTVVTKNAKDLSYEEICGCMFVPLIGKEGWKEQK